MSELPEGIEPAQVPSPRDSASGIVLCRSDDGGWSVLLGLRSRRSRFMPGHLAFPGGALDRADRPSEPGAYGRCIARELGEETGLDIPPRQWTDAGERTTPPMFPVRFRTRFFVARLPEGIAAAEVRPANAENERLTLERPGSVLEQWESGAVALPPPVLPILRAIDSAAGADPKELARRVAAANEGEERAPRIEFAPNVWMLPVRTATLPPATHTNVWMPGGRRFVIIDPGSPEPDEIRRLLEVVERRQSLGHEPLAVLLTHHHRDHTGGAAQVARALGLPLRSHPGVTIAPPGTLTLPFREGEELDLEGMTLRAVGTPGHAPGHLAFHLPELRLLVSGDLLSGLSTILIDPDHGDMGAYLDSLARVDRLGCRMFLPGHGPPLPARAVAKVIEHRRRREERILDLLGQAAKNLELLADGAYTDVPRMPAVLTRRQTLSHLLLLEKRGLSRREDAEGRRWSRAGTVEEPATAARIESILRESFRPLHFELRDDSERHAGHPGAMSGGGHYRVVLVSEAFEGKTRLEQHRLVNEAVRELFGEKIHALGLKTLAPSEWNP